MNLAERSIRSGAWSAGANLVKVVVLFGRSILLARLLPVDTFGTYTLAFSIIALTGIIPSFGLGGALLHRAPETADESTSAATHFTLTLMLTAVWALALIAGSLLFAEGELQSTLIVLTIIYAGLHLTDTPRFVLTRRVEHRRLAVIDVTETIIASAVAIFLALRGATIGALVATDAIALLVYVVVLYLWRPVWRPQLLWARDKIDYFLKFGARNFTGIALGAAIDRVDDIWTGVALGSTPLGFYSRAYAFATYPRRVLAYPVNNVASGTMAELKKDRQALSRTFFRTNALLVRTGFFAAGLLFLVAPEFVAVLLGDKWLPMVTPFRLLLIYSLLDPVRAAMSGLFVAAGHPEQLGLSRGIQLVLLIVLLPLLGRPLGIGGVAIAVDTMLVIGIIILMMQAKAHADFSATRLFAVPIVALLVGGGLAVAAQRIACSPPDTTLLCSNYWYTGLLKSMTFVAGFAAVNLTLERQEMSEVWRSVRRVFRNEGQAIL